MFPWPWQAVGRPWAGRGQAMEGERSACSSAFPRFHSGVEGLSHFMEFDFPGNLPPRLSLYFHTGKFFTEGNFAFFPALHFIEIF